MEASTARSAAGSAMEAAAQARLAAARDILHGEAAAILHIAEGLDEAFLVAVEALRDCEGQIVVSGMGKAGLIGRKLSATFASTGSRSIFLHPAEAVHGDLGRVDRADTLLLLSYSGETEELNRLLPTLKAQARDLIAITSSRRSTLGQAATIVLELGPLQEVCPLGLAPSTSTTAMLALGDALALVVSRERGFTREDFARNHPAGSLGRQLASVDQVMRPLESCRLADARSTLCEVLVNVSRPGRRSGAVMLLDDQRRLVGVFTDSDLARLLEQRRHSQLDRPIGEVMSTRFRTVASGQPLGAAIDLLVRHKISELPVVDQTGAPLGMIDITDVVGLVAEAQARQEREDGNQSAQGDAPPGDSCRWDDGQLISVPITLGRKGER